jgi:hypothetical protein
MRYLLPPKEPAFPPHVVKAIHRTGRFLIEQSLSDAITRHNPVLYLGSTRVDRTDIEDWLKWKRDLNRYWCGVSAVLLIFSSILSAWLSAA